MLKQVSEYFFNLIFGSIGKESYPVGLAVRHIHHCKDSYLFWFYQAINVKWYENFTQN